jgi:hypothetical protein
MSSGRRSNSIDTLAAEQLRRKLSAGSSRVFDCERLHKGVVKAGGTPDQFMFHKIDLNRVIYIKEPVTDETMARRHQALFLLQREGRVRGRALDLRQ